MSKRKIKNHDRQSYRLKSWDYGSNAAYFVTICTKNKEQFFGEIIAKEEGIVTDPVIDKQDFASQVSKSFSLRKTEIGRVAHRNWLAIPDHFPFVKLGSHIIMPDHMHGIIIIDKPPGDLQPVATPVGMQNLASQLSSPKNKFGPQSKNLASIIRGYKASVKKHATMNNIDFKWQGLYHDHIIRNGDAFDRISYYIESNPRKWYYNNRKG